MVWLCACGSSYIFIHCAFKPDSITRLSQRIRTVWELQLVFLPLYLEPVLVINDRETSPTRHEFYIRLFMRSCCSASFKLMWREHTAWHGSQKATRQFMSSFLFSCCGICLIYAKWKSSSRQGMVVGPGLLLYWHLFFKEQQTEKALPDISRVCAG